MRRGIIYLLALYLFSAGCSGTGTIPEKKISKKISSVRQVGNVDLAKQEIIWSLGRWNEKSGEFGLTADKYRQFVWEFPDKVEVSMWEKEPQKQWSAIHPGPKDAWAELEEHPFSINFKLDESQIRDGILKVWLTETTEANPPKFDIEVNGKNIDTLSIQPGSGQFVQEKAKGSQKIMILVPANVLKEGINTLTLTCKEGSWVIYDALRYSQFTEDVEFVPSPAVSVIPTPFVTSNGMRMLEMSIINEGGDGSANLEIEIGGRSVLHNAKGLSLKRWSSQTINVEIPEVDEKSLLTVKVIPDKGKEGVATLDLLPAKMDVHLMFGSHTDVGYTHLQPIVAEIHCQNLERALEFCDKTDNWPEGLRFKFTAEASWQMDNFLETREEEKINQLIKRMKEGRIAMNALYLNCLTGMMSPEALIRLRYFSRNFEKKYGIPCPVGYHTDVPGYTWGLASVMANSGVKYFQCGMNPDGTGLHYNFMPMPPFYWIGIDGSKVLVWYTMRYGFRSYNGLGENMESTEQYLKDILTNRFNKSKYPYDMIMLHCIFGDNTLMDFKCVEVFKEWNEKYRSPRFVFSTPTEFLTQLEQKYGDKIPSIKGDWGTYWEDGIASSAHKTALHMRNQADAEQAERLATFASIISGCRYPYEELEAVYKNLLLYNEHTWGSWHSISAPDHPNQIGQWKIKASYVEEARKGIDEVTSATMAKLSSEVTVKEPSIVVWNMLSWNRTDFVEATFPESIKETNFILRDAESRKEIPYQVTDKDKRQIAFIANDIPSCGYKVFNLSKGKQKEAVSTLEVKDNVIENKFYRIVVDTAKGAITSLKDKVTGRELVNSKEPFLLGQFVYHGNPREMKATLSDIKISKGKAGPVFSTLVISGSLPGANKASVEIILYDAIKRVDVKNTIDKMPVRDKEALYFAFPFAEDEANVKLELTLSVLTPEVEQIEGTNRDWYTVTGAISVSGKKHSILWVSRDAPLVELGDINTQKWLKKLEIKAPTLYSYAMNNYWWTNYRADQDPGEHRFDYSITDFNEGYDPVQAHRFSQEVLMPMMVSVISSPQNGKLKESSRSFLQLTDKQCSLIGLKRAVDDRDGFIVRLLNLTDQKQEPLIKGIFEEFKQERVNLVEEKEAGQDNNIGTHGVLNLKYSK